MEDNEEDDTNKTIEVEDGEEIDDQIDDNESNSIEIVPLVPYDLGDDEDIELPPLVPMPVYANFTFNENGVITHFEMDQANNNINNLPMVEFDMTNFTMPQEFMDALLIVQSARIHGLGDAQMFLNTLSTEQRIDSELQRLRDTLERCREEDPIELECSIGTKDAILQIDDFTSGDEAFVLDDCFTSFYMYETLKQIFSIQKSVLNPFSQQPIRRIIRVKLNVK